MPISEADWEKLEEHGRRLAGLQMQARALALALTLRAFNLNQPRVPAGNPDGGRWTSGGGDGIGDARIEAIAFKPIPKYDVNLEEEERRGGHTIRRHVGKSDERLLLEAGQEYLRAVVEANRAPAQGSFDTRESANNFVNRVLESNKATVDLVAQGKEPERTIDQRFGSVTGKEAVWTDPQGGPYMRKTFAVRVIIVHDPRFPEGYRLKTAFPINDRPTGDTRP